MCVRGRVCAWSCVRVCHVIVLLFLIAELKQEVIGGKKSNDDFKIIAHITKSSLIF